MQLFEHLRDDPHWMDFGFVRIPDSKALELIEGAIAAGGSRLPWTVVYEWIYILEMRKLVGASYEAHRNYVAKACEQLGCVAPILAFPSFVLRPIRDAIRTHLGMGTLPPADYTPVYRRDMNSDRRRFEVYYGGEPLAKV